ncbi:unnamed protein product [Rotaria sp. Silwood1]|nr:unnamed protein product [Rotaria sp. Silwood1]CAF1618538.1 unnamed protein product [Rotaria sp. Silwood1]CAF3711534.1 unnamed protein product [Rotaria sp. Silwood1]CAF3761245.1 unnamed protein product [Rotaria sp. Silwood1]
MYILGSKDECEKAGRGLESAIRTDFESEAEVSYSTQNKLDQRKENQDPSLNSNYTKPTTANVHVPLVDPQDEDNENSDTSNVAPFRKSLEWSVGSSDSVDVLLIPADPTNKTRYVTKILNTVFSREDLESIQRNALPTDERYLFVKGKI